ncbi:STN domain-containing protein [Xanthomonas arboricola]|uniref:STN domain-containing protein n=1 Tax=Xanthomonas arboricola TaxID=56448 RepID=UPI001290623D|nr:STN domain-containing protein [Xanthomonas arboricola]
MPLLSLLLTAAATGPAEIWRFDVPAQTAASGIAAFSRQATTVQILVSQDAVAARRTSSLKGAYPIESALTVLLRHSGLRWLKTGPGTYSIVLAEQASGSAQSHSMQPAGASAPVHQVARPGASL